MKSIDNIIKDLPFGASALVQQRFNHKNITIIVIKDNFNSFIDSKCEMEFHFKGAVVKNRKILSAHVIIHVSNNLDDKFYPLYFDYYEESSLKLLHNLTKQKEICIIISDGSEKYISKTFNNNLKLFLKKYIRDSINFGYRWDSEEYKDSILRIIESYNGIKDFWDNLGSEVHMGEILK